MKAVSKKFTWGLAAAGALAILMAACGGSSGSTGSPTAPTGSSTATTTITIQ